MTNLIAVSAYSLRQQIGPLSVTYPDSAGNTVTRTVDYPSEISIAQFIERVSTDLRVQHIELCQIQLSHPDSTQLSPIREALDAWNVRLLNFPIDVGDLGAGNQQIARAAVRENAYWFDVAHSLGSRFVRVNAGSPFAGAAPDMTALVGSLDELADLAAALEMRLLVENHGGASSDPEFLLTVIDRVGRDRLGILLDLANFVPILELLRAPGGQLEPGRATAAFEAILPSIELLAPHASLMHAKAFDSGHEGEASVFDSARALETALNAGYHGPISVEYEGVEGDPWLATRRAVQIVRDSVRSNSEPPVVG
jgi:hypothetical protein